MSVSVDNQFDALASSPRDEGKDSSLRSRKDDLKEQAHQAREGIKNKVAGLKEQVVGSGLYDQVASAAASGLEMAKGKFAAATGKDLSGKSKEEIVEEVQDSAAQEWETVKKRGKAAGKKAVTDAQEKVDATIDENLTPAQKQKLAKGVKQAKAAGKQGLAKANGLFDQLLSAPQLRGVKTFIVNNNLQVPAMIFGAIVSLWLGLTLIRLITMATTPSVPEFDIHSKEASMNWLKYHAGEYKDKAMDARESLTGRVASFLANHELEKIQASAVDWKDIGMKKLGLTEPTYSEQIWNWVTGRPTTWQGRVESVLSLAKTGIKGYAGVQGLAAKAAMNALKGAAADKLGLHAHEPSTLEKVKNYVTGHDASIKGRVTEEAASIGERVVDSIRANIPGLHKAAPVAPAGVYDSIKNTIVDGVDSIRSHLPGGAEAVAEAKARAYAATHPSTLDNIKSGAEYVKNRVLHGAEEAAHIAQDRAQEALDKAKYKTGL